MRLIYERDDGAFADAPGDSQFSCWLHDDGSFMVQVPPDGLAPFLAEKYVVEFLNALRRAYADRYDITRRMARRGATKETPHDQRNPDGHRES